MAVAKKGAKWLVKCNGYVLTTEAISEASTRNFDPKF